MRVLHDGEVLASGAEVADTPIARARGLMFRRSFPEALVFEFDGAGTRWVHMLFVAAPIDVVWARGGRVERVERLRPWVGLARAPADTLIELPAGAAAGVEAGDRIEVERGARGPNGENTRI